MYAQGGVGVAALAVAYKGLYSDSAPTELQLDQEKQRRAHQLSEYDKQARITTQKYWSGEKET